MWGGGGGEWQKSANGKHGENARYRGVSIRRAGHAAKVTHSHCFCRLDLYIQKDTVDGYGNNTMQQGTVKKAILLPNKADQEIFILGLVSLVLFQPDKQALTHVM